jgi:hypothetical protein
MTTITFTVYGAYFVIAVVTLILGCGYEARVDAKRGWSDAPLSYIAILFCAALWPFVLAALALVATAFFLLFWLPRKLGLAALNKWKPME